MNSIFIKHCFCYFIGKLLIKQFSFEAKKKEKLISVDYFDIKLIFIVAELILVWEYTFLLFLLSLLCVHNNAEIYIYNLKPQGTITSKSTNNINCLAWGFLQFFFLAKNFLCIIDYRRKLCAIDFVGLFLYSGN